MTRPRAAWLTTIAANLAAIAFLRRSAAPHYRRFARAPRDAAPAWRPAPDNLDRICCCSSSAPLRVIEPL